VVLNSSHLDCCLVREHHPPFNKEPVPSNQHRIQHTLLHQEVTHPLTHYYVHLLLWPREFLKFLNFGLNDHDLVLLLVQFNYLLCLHYNVTIVYGLHHFSPSSRTKEWKYGRATADIHDYFVLKQVGILKNSVSLGVSADRVFYHVLVDSEVRLRVELVVRVLILFD